MKCAIKALRKRHCELPDQREKFAAEGERGVTLRHPNIVAIYEVVSQGLQNFLVMEFLEGTSLRDFIKLRKKFEPHDATRLITDVAARLGLCFSARHYAPRP